MSFDWDSLKDTGASNNETGEENTNNEAVTQDDQVHRAASEYKGWEGDDQVPDSSKRFSQENEWAGSVDVGETESNAANWGHSNSTKSYDKDQYHHNRDRESRFREGGGYSKESYNNKRHGEQGYYNENKFAEFGDKGMPRQPITYEPQHLNYDESALFSQRESGGIDFTNYDKIDVEMTGGKGETLQMVSRFEDCNFEEKIMKNVRRCGYVHPTPIQKSVIPIVNEGNHDIMACAQTGSGKTAAFALSILSQMLKSGEHNQRSSHFPSPHVLLIGPTRELVNQLFKEMQKFSWGTGINCARVYGGVARSFLLKGLQSNCHVLCATPGRLLAFLKNGEINFDNLKYLILDEADRMLDMGFIGDIKNIVYNFGMADCARRRCFMFSATFPVEVQKLAAELLNPNFYFVSVGMVGGAADSISQKLEKLAVTQKRDRLIEILRDVSQGTKTLVFVETKRQADYLTIYLCESGLDAISIHGDRLQEQREQALNSFIKGLSPILVATSVAARGLDIPSVDLVINFDMPKDVDEYVHRIGRTGRIGNRGLAIGFFQENRDEHLATDLLKILRNANQSVPDWLELMAGPQMGGSSQAYGGYNRPVRDARVRSNNADNSGLYHKKFNAMDANPYPRPSQQTYSNTTASAWNGNDNYDNGDQAGYPQNDDECWD